MTPKEIIMEEALKKIRDDSLNNYDYRIIARVALEEIEKID